MTADDAGWDYKPDGQTKSEAPALSNRGNRRDSAAKSKTPESIEWTASEYIEHSRGLSWYLALLAITAVLTALIYWVTTDYFAAGITVLTGTTVAIFTIHKPRELTYRLDRDGLRAGDKLHPYSQFKSFAVIRESGLSSINLIPIKRFMPIISAYFEQNQEVEIVEILGQYLPYERRELDGVEQLSRRLRF